MSKPPAPSDIADKFMLRLPNGMRERIADAARANNRSMNAEIVSRLQATLDHDGEGSLLEASVDNAVLKREHEALMAKFTRMTEELGPVLIKLHGAIDMMNERGIGPKQDNERAIKSDHNSTRGDNK